MSKLALSLAVCDYDRCRALFDGRVTIEGCDVYLAALEPEECFHRAFKHQEFDITELSMSSHTITTGRGTNEYIGVPAFVSRLFRHSGIYIRTDRGIESPEDLAGRTIGLPEYQISANVWIRGILSDEYGVKVTDVKWRSGGLEQPGRRERAPIELPPDIDLQPIPADRTISQMLEAGELDGMIGARPPSCFLRGEPGIARLFPDVQTAEESYYKRTKLFPIMHLIGIRKSLAEQHPWLAVSVLKAFVEAKRLAMEDLSQIGHLYVSLPWAVAEKNRVMALMGEDYWPYGLDANRHVLEVFLRYHHEQGLSKQRLAPEDLFAPSTLDLAKI
jgi:4,5-dihydroxyphthalate decarboxylase